MRNGENKGKAAMNIRPRKRAAGRINRRGLNKMRGSRFYSHTLITVSPVMHMTLLVHVRLAGAESQVHTHQWWEEDYKPIAGR